MTLRILNSIQLTESLVLVTTDGSGPFRHGQYVRVRNGEKEVYLALAGPCGSAWEFIISRTENHLLLLNSEVWESSDPEGSGFKQAETDMKITITHGSGISAVRSLLLEDPGIPLFYGTRSADISWLQKLVPQSRIIPAVSADAGSHVQQILRLQKLDWPAISIYIAGSRDMVAECREVLCSSGVLPDNILTNF